MMHFHIFTILIKRVELKKTIPERRKRVKCSKVVRRTSYSIEKGSCQLRKSPYKYSNSYFRDVLIFGKIRYTI